MPSDELENHLAGFKPAKGRSTREDLDDTAASERPTPPTDELDDLLGDFTRSTGRSPRAAGAMPAGLDELHSGGAAGGGTENVEDELDLLLDLDGFFGGGSGRRANNLLFEIESKTARLLSQSRRATERFVTEEAAEERELAFLEAYAQARQPPVRVTVQDLERYARDWAALVPENAGLRAALANALAGKYRLSHRSAPGIRAALGLDTEEVRQAYERQYRRPLTSIYAPAAGVRERLGWRWAAVAKWLENLPPFWTAFALTLTETVGASILALPVAMAGVGPLPGLVFLVVLGLVNVLTVAYMAEATIRSGTIRYGNAFLGRVVADYLGGAGSVVLTGALAISNFLSLPAFYIGFAATMESATQLPAVIWVVLLFAVGLYFLRRESLDATIAFALVVGAFNIGLIVALSLLAFTHLKPANFTYANVPFLNGAPFEPGLVGLIFGVILSAYYGHVSVSTCGGLVLRRDPSGRSLLWGAVAAQLTTIGLYCLWLLAVNGAIAPARLAAEAGTALTPLAAEVGGVVSLLGAVFVILGLGMGSIHLALGLFYLARERLPARAEPLIALPRGRGRLLLRERGRRPGAERLRIGLVYLGRRDELPLFRLEVELSGELAAFEHAASGQWEILGESGYGPLLERFPALEGRRMELGVEVVEAGDDLVTLRAGTSLRLTYEGEWARPGMSMAGAYELPQGELEMLTLLVRRGDISAREAAELSGQAESSALALLRSLVGRRLAVETGTGESMRYAARLGATRGRRVTGDIWRRLEPGAGTNGEQRARRPRRGTATSMLPRFAAGEQARWLLAVSPVIIAFLLTEWMLLTNSGSFTGLLSFMGMILISLLAGVFPVLLLIAGRLKGDYVPAVVYRLLGNRALLAAIYVVSLASIFLHGLVIWEDPLWRAGALLAGVLMIAINVVMLRQGAFRRRLVVELRQEEGAGDSAVFALVEGGKPLAAEVRLDYPEGEQRLRAASGVVPAFSSLRRASFIRELNGGSLGERAELKVWAHKVTAEGDSEGLAALLKVEQGNETLSFDLRLSSGQVLLPRAGGVRRLEITLMEPGSS